MKKAGKVVIGVAAAVLLLGAGLVVKAKSGGSSGGSTYYSDVSSIFGNELGSFNYTISVRSCEHTDGSGYNLDDVQLADIERMDIDREDVQEGKHSNAISKEWGNKEGTETGDWEYPNYQINISGTTMGVEPLKMQLAITLATEYFSDLFTEVTVFEGNYYVNIEQMRYWLVNSKDTYLTEIGRKLPEGSKYLVIPEAEFVHYSRYAEAGEKGFSGVTGMVTLYRRGLTILNQLWGSISSAAGDTGLNNGDVKTLKLEGADALCWANAVKNVVTRFGDFYDSVVAAGVQSNLYTQEQYEQAVREEDNRIDSVHDIMMYLNTHSLESLGLRVSGASRQYTNGYGNQAVEATLNVSYVAGGTDYSIQASLQRSGNTAEIMLPNGSQTTKDKLSSPTLLVDTLNKVWDYFSVTGIKYEDRLELSPGNIADWTLDDFIDLVNETGTAGYYVTRNNVQGFIDEWGTFEVTPDSTDAEVINAKLVSDFMDCLNSLTGGVVKVVEVDKVQEVEQYPLVTNEVGGISMTGGVDKDSATALFIQVNMLFENLTEEVQIVDLTDFQLKTLLSSVYPSNNEIMLRNYDNTWDFGSLKTELVLQPGEIRREPLYFVISDDTGYMDLWYNGEKVGEVIKY